MTTEERLRTWALDRIKPFVESGVAKRLRRDSHLNEFRKNPEPFDESIVPEMLQKLVKVTRFRTDRATDALNALKAGADEIRYRTDAHLKQTTIDAILVSFVNYLANTCCVDYALATEHLRKLSLCRA